MTKRIWFGGLIFGVLFFEFSLVAQNSNSGPNNGSNNKGGGDNGLSAISTANQQCQEFKNICPDQCQEIFSACMDTDSNSFDMNDVLSGAAGISTGAFGSTGTLPMVNYRTACMSTADYQKAQQDISTKVDKLNSDINQEQKDAISAQKDFVSTSTDLNDKIIKTQQDYNKSLADIAKKQQEDAAAKLKTDQQLRKAVTDSYAQEGSLRTQVLSQQLALSQAMRSSTTALSLGVEQCRAQVKKQLADAQLGGTSHSSASLIQLGNRQKRLVRAAMNSCYQDVVQNANMRVKAAQTQLQVVNRQIDGIHEDRQSLQSQQKQADQAALQQQAQAQTDTTNLKNSTQQTISNLQSSLQQQQSLEQTNLMRLSNETSQNQNLMNRYSNQLSGMGEQSSGAAAAVLPPGYDFAKLNSMKAACDAAKQDLQNAATLQQGNANSNNTN